MATGIVFFVEVFDEAALIFRSGLTDRMMMALSDAWWHVPSEGPVASAVVEASTLHMQGALDEPFWSFLKGPRHVAPL